MADEEKRQDFENLHVSDFRLLALNSRGKMRETIKQMIERVRRDPVKNHCSKHGVILEWINGRCAHCVHYEECGHVYALSDCKKHRDEVR